MTSDGLLFSLAKTTRNILDGARGSERNFAQHMRWIRIGIGLLLASSGSPAYQLAPTAGPTLPGKVLNPSTFAALKKE